MNPSTMSDGWPFNWIAFDDLILVGVALCVVTVAAIFIVFRSGR